MISTRARRTVETIPFVWRFRLTLRGVRLSRPAHDQLTAGYGERHVTYRVTMGDGDLVGVESAPLAVRINIRAASFVLRAFGQRSAEIHAEHSGALCALALAPDGPRSPNIDRADLYLSARHTGRIPLGSPAKN